jgi:iron complex outermembrane recepter protein
MLVSSVGSTKAEVRKILRITHNLIRLLLWGGITGAFPAIAQQFSISGTVTDAQGLVAEATVTLTSPSGSKSQAQTDDLGKFTFDNLVAGPYELAFSKKGFAPAVRATVLVGESATVDVTLSLAGVYSSVDVTDTASNSTASRMDVPDRDLPTQVSTVTQRIIQEQGLNDVATALENISGASVQVQYGVYEWYTLDGFAQQTGNDFLYIDGMTLMGNRPQTQLDNVEEIQVMKGPDGVLYGGAGASMGGMVNVIRKKPQATRTADLLYRYGRWNRNDVAGGTSGTFFGLSRLLYRLDGGYSHADGWRDAGSDRGNVSPSLLWLISSRMRISFNESLSHDNYDMDAGVPIALLDTPGFPLNRRLNPADNFEHFRSWENNIVFSANLTNRLELRNSFFHARNNDQYLDSETLNYVATTNTLDRTDLYYKHYYRPMQDQTDIIGTYDLFGMRHKFMVGYEYEDQYDWTDRTAPVGTTSISNIVIAPIYIPAFLSPGWVDPATPITSLPTVRKDYIDQAINAESWQDQITVTKRLRINLTGRYDDWKRVARDDPYSNGVLVSRGADMGWVHETAYDYRYGAVYTPFGGYELYASTATSFHPVNTIPTNGAILLPGRSKSYEAGQKWQTLHRRLIVNAAFRRIIYYNLLIPLGGGNYDQAGKADANVADLDVDGDLGYGFHALAVYGYALPRYDSYKTSATGQNLAGEILEYAPRHTSKIWITRSWRIAEGTSLTSSVGMRYMGAEYENNTDTIFVGGYTVFSGSVGLHRRKYDILLNAENLLDRQRYFVSQINGTQLYPGQPINVFATVRYRFKN